MSILKKWIVMLSRVINPDTEEKLEFTMEAERIID
jgi:hypothetical protein